MADSNNSNFVAAVAARYGSGLRKFMLAHLRNMQDVPDLTQEVYLRLMRLSRLELIRNPEAYLITVASHVLYQHSLRQAAKPPIIDITEVDITQATPELLTPDGADPATRASNIQRVEQFQKILARLPPRVAAALVMHRIGGFTVQEVADALGVARETAKKYLTRAAEHCRKKGFGPGQGE